MEKQAAVVQPAASEAEAQAIALSIVGGHVRSVRSYQVRSFEVMLAQAAGRSAYAPIVAQPIERCRDRR